MALAALAGVAYSTIRSAEQTGRVTPWLAQRVAPALGLDPRELAS